MGILNKQPLGFLPSIEDTADPGNFFHQGTFAGNNFGHPYVPPKTFDPNAPGSIFANQRYSGAAPNLPAPGTATNGLANGTQNGGVDWAPIIARALRKS